MGQQFLDVKVKVGKESYELEQGIVNFIRQFRKALANGFQPGDDMPVILASAMADLSPAIKGMDLLDDEAREDFGAMINVCGLMASDLMAVFMEDFSAEEIEAEVEEA